MRTKGEYDFEGEVATHVEHALPLVGDGNEVAVLRIEILREVQVIGISDVGEVGTVHKQRADDLAGFAIDELSAEPGVDQCISGRRDFGVKRTIDVILLPIMRYVDLEIRAREEGASLIGELKFQLAMNMRRGRPGDMLGGIGRMGQPAVDV